MTKFAYISTSFALLFVLNACDPGDGTDTAGSAETTGGGSTGGEATAGDTTPATETATTDATATTGDTDPAETTTDTAAESTDPDTGADLLALGEACKENADCASEMCKEWQSQGMSGAVCSECLTHKDCQDSGEGNNCSGGADIGYFTCTDGPAGAACDDDDACADDLLCGEVFGERKTCGECASDDDCEGDTPICGFDVNLTMDPDAVSQRICVGEGSQANDTVCDMDGSGDDACEGFCAELALGDEIKLGLCGDCRPGESDCADGQECEEPSFMGGLRGSRCVDADDTGDEESTG